MPILTQETIINLPLEETFNFFDKPQNLQKVTPKQLNFRILTPDNLLKMDNGSIFEYEISLMGIPMLWRSIINNYNPPYEFVDIQLKGPYKSWHHHHQFIKITPHQTKVIDTVRYEMPLGILGKIAHFLFVKKQLKTIFAYRENLSEKIIKES